MAGDESLITPTIGASAAEAADVARTQFGLDGVAVALGGERDDNFRIDTGSGVFAMKIANPAQDLAALDMEQRCLDHVAAVDPDLPIPRTVVSLDGALVASVSIRDVTCGVRVVTYLPGSRTGPGTPASHRILGRLAARLDLAMLDFTHPALDREFMWDIANVGSTRTLLHHLSDEQSGVVTPWLDEFDEHTAPRIAGLPRQAIHADLNTSNLVWGSEDTDEIAGVFDFGDMVRSARIIEPALAAAYQCIGHDDPVAIIADVTSGYHEVSALGGSEIGMVPDLVMARFVQSVVIGTWRAELHPGNREYILTDVTPSWLTLRRLISIGADSIRESVHAACESRSNHDQ